MQDFGPMRVCDSASGPDKPTYPPSTWTRRFFYWRGAKVKIRDARYNPCEGNEYEVVFPRQGAGMTFNSEWVNEGDITTEEKHAGNVLAR